MYSVSSWQVTHSEFDLTVGKLSPILDDWYEAVLRKLIDNFAGFAASGVNRHPKYLWQPAARHLVCKIPWANEHVIPPQFHSYSAVHPERPSAKLQNRPYCRYSFPR
jgi:hypothetical protein